MVVGGSVNLTLTDHPILVPSSLSFHSFPSSPVSTEQLLPGLGIFLENFENQQPPGIEPRASDSQPSQFSISLSMCRQNPHTSLPVIVSHPCLREGRAGMLPCIVCYFNHTIQHSKGVCYVLCWSGLYRSVNMITWDVVLEYTRPHQLRWGDWECGYHTSCMYMHHRWLALVLHSHTAWQPKVVLTSFSLGFMCMYLRLQLCT